MRGVLALPGPQGRLHGVQVGLFLELSDVFLVADPLVTKPVGDLDKEMNQLFSFDRRSFFVKAKFCKIVLDLSKDFLMN